MEEYFQHMNENSIEMKKVWKQQNFVQVIIFDFFCVRLSLVVVAASTRLSLWIKYELLKIQVNRKIQTERRQKCTRYFSICNKCAKVS